MKRKNIFKSLLAAAMALTMIFGAAPLSGFVGIRLPMLSLKAEAATEIKTTEDGLFEYAVVSTTGLPNTVTITRCNKNASGEVTIPKTIEGCEVKQIGDGAFRYCTSLTEVTIPNSVTGIGDNAFGSCTSLSKVKLPNALNKIGRCAFCYCISLTGITIPDGVTEIGADAFYYCTSLAKVNLSDDLTKIGNRIFLNAKVSGR